MMRSEANTPIENRFLLVLGKASKKVIEAVKDGLPDKLGDNTLILFLSYSNADFPVGYIFTKVFKQAEPQNHENTTCTIIAVTQQFAKSVDEISHGWKTICALQFQPTIPKLIQNLPEIDNWYWYEEQRDRICLSSDETWQTLTK